MVELNELRGLHTREAGGIKTWITERRDTWVPKYKEFTTSYPRRCVLYGTTDNEEFLDDPAGNRRWLPFQTTGLARDEIEKDRLQLWAEAAIRWRAGGVEWQDAERLGFEERSDYEIGDVWAGEVQEWVQKRRDEEPFTLRAVAIGIGLDPRTLNRSLQTRLGNILRKLQFKKARTMANGRRETFWS